MGEVGDTGSGATNVQTMSDVALATQMHRERMQFADQRQGIETRRVERRRHEARLVVRLLARRESLRAARAGWRSQHRLGPKPIRLGSVVLDCSDPASLAEFYRGLLGGKVGALGAGTAELRVHGQLLSFRGVADYEYPKWPDSHPEYVRLDLAVREFAASHTLVTSMGAVPLDPVEAPAPGYDRPYRVYADPAGHPFSLCLR